jgi:hypothetical protein
VLEDRVFYEVELLDKHRQVDFFLLQILTKRFVLLYHELMMIVLVYPLVLFFRQVFLALAVHFAIFLTYKYDILVHLNIEYLDYITI